jgi:Na+-driven multidrug efflux pump
MFELNDNAAEILSLYLLFNIVFSIFNTVYFINGAYLNVVDAHNKVLWSNIIKTFILLPLFTYFLESKFGYEGVLTSLLLLSVIANIIQLLMTRKEYKVLLKKNKKID